MRAVFNLNRRKVALNSAFGICRLELLHCCQLALLLQLQLRSILHGSIQINCLSQTCTNHWKSEINKVRETLIHKADTRVPSGPGFLPSSCLRQAGKVAKDYQIATVMPDKMHLNAGRNFRF